MYQKWILLSCLLVAFVACKSKKTTPETGAPKNTPATVDVMVAGAQTLNNSIEINGSVLPFESVELHPEVGGRITYLNLPEGKEVTQGTILAKVNDADLQAQLQKVKVQQQLAALTEARLKKLLAVNGINQADYDNALNQLNNLKADEAVLKAQIDKTVVKAPFTGVLGLRMVSMGAYVTTTNTLTTLQQTSKIKIDFAVPEAYAANVKIGQTIQIATNNSSKSYTAQVIASEPQMDANTRNLKYRAVTSASLPAGAFVKVMVPVNQTSASIMVPTSCIIPDARSKQIVVVKNGQGKFVKVQTGVRNAGSVQVTDGLKIGDSVVVTGVLFVRPNQVVKVRSVKQLAELTN